MPDNKGIPVGKKRYTLTLSESTVNRWHSYLGKIHAPKSMMSSVVDDQLKAMLDSLESFERMQKQKGSELGMGDFFSVIGDQLNKLDNDQKPLPIK